MIIYVIAF